MYVLQRKKSVFHSGIWGMGYHTVLFHAVKKTKVILTIEPHPCVGVVSLVYIHTLHLNRVLCERINMKFFLTKKRSNPCLGRNSTLEVPLVALPQQSLLFLSTSYNGEPVYTPNLALKLHTRFSWRSRPLTVGGRQGAYRCSCQEPYTGTSDSEGPLLQSP